MPKRKEKTGTIATQVKVGITPKKTNLLGATRIKGIRNPRGEITTSVKGEITILLEPPSIVPFVVSSVIILIIVHKSLILNG
jgi:hypothetical protein